MDKIDTDRRTLRGQLAGRNAVVYAHAVYRNRSGEDMRLPPSVGFFWDREEYSGLRLPLMYHHYFPVDTDPDGHLAFCAGTMPPHVYADWLEERLSDVPVELLALLRERVGDTN